MLTVKNTMRAFEQYKMNFIDAEITTYNDKFLHVHSNSNQTILTIYKDATAYKTDLLLLQYSEINLVQYLQYLPIRIQLFINDWRKR